MFRRLVLALGYLTLSVAVAMILFAGTAISYSLLVQYQSRLEAWPTKPLANGLVKWNPDHPDVVRILTIDGGAIFGLVPLEILKKLEELSGRPVSELFDFVSGTSTGAIITAGLLAPDKNGGQRYSAEAMIEEYVDLSQTILRPPTYHRILTLNGLLGPRLLNHAKIVSSNAIFGDDNFGDLIRPAMIPAYSRRIGGLEVFRNWEEADAGLDVGALVAAATSAPTFFPAIHLEGSPEKSGLYADAGLILNDPAFLAFLHALNHHPTADIVIISVGTTAIDKITLHQGVRGGALDWLVPAQTMVFQGQADTSTLFLDMAKNIDAPYNLVEFRLAPIVPVDWGIFDPSTKNIDRLRRLAQDYVQENAAQLAEIADLLTQGKTGDFPRGDSAHD